MTSDTSNKHPEGYVSIKNVILAIVAIVTVSSVTTYFLTGDALKRGYDRGYEEAYDKAQEKWAGWAMKQNFRSYWPVDLFGEYDGPLPLEEYDKILGIMMARYPDKIALAINCILDDAAGWVHCGTLQELAEDYLSLDEGGKPKILCKFADGTYGCEPSTEIMEELETIIREKEARPHE